MDNKDQDLVCRDCGKTFTFSQEDASYFQRRGWPMPPATCRSCRTRTKRQQASQPQPAATPSYATGDPNEYRSPMQGAYSTAPKMRDWRPTRTVATDGGEQDDDDIWARDPNAIGDPNEYRSPMQGGEQAHAGAGARRRFGRRPDRGDEARAYAYQRQIVGDTNDYRSPMAGQFSTGAEGQPRRRGDDAARAARPGAAEGGERRARRRRPRAMFDAVCAQCGGVAQVPFEPTAGRDVYCKACFDARRAPTRDEAGPGSDA